MWTGLFLVAASAWPGVLTILSPAVMVWNLYGGTGKSFLEKDIGDRRPDYADYVRRTSGFFPWPPKPADPSATKDASARRCGSGMMGVMRPPLAELLDLQPHPEGGWYRQTWASPETVTLTDGRVRATATLIHFLLPTGESSAWHRVSSDEVWLAHTGSVALELGGDGAAPEADGDAETVVLGLDLAAGEVAQAVVPAHVWQRTVPDPLTPWSAASSRPGSTSRTSSSPTAPPTPTVRCNAPRPVPRTRRSTRRRRPTQPDLGGGASHLATARPVPPLATTATSPSRSVRWTSNPLSCNAFIVAGAGWP